MTRRIISLLAALTLVIALLPAMPAHAQTGNGGTVLDTDPTGGYEGDYVVIYNPSTSSYSGLSTGNMTGRIETEVDPYFKGMTEVSSDDEPYIIDVDGMIAEIDAAREPVDPPEGTRTSYEVGDVRSFYISSYSPGPDNLSFKCVAKGEH